MLLQLYPEQAACHGLVVRQKAPATIYAPLAIVMRTRHTIYQHGDDARGLE